MKRKKAFRFFGRNIELFTLSLPAVIYIFIMAYIPMFGVVIAFKNYRYDKGILGSEWIGFKNFEFLFKSETALRITRNTVVYNLGYMVLTTIAALTVAILLNEIAKRWLKIYQTALILPFFLSWVVMSYITQAFLDHENGFINSWLVTAGMEKISWYFEAEYWPYILNIVHLWKAIGFSAMVYYAGILGIDGELYEAARIDGAKRMQMVTNITIPQLTPLIIILLILSIGNMFRGDFGLHFFIPNNNGMTYSTTDIIDTYIYRALSEIADVSMASAVGLYQSFVGFVLVVSANLIVRRINEDNSLF
ncbi:putative multiple-sugar transport system permease YteP [Paenibacillus allorhizoplanae]|uniref:Multiple-sugar transport system permease YteP n=1 Tax=Paenibacillus allorhizoplanae TaxID=2905648 RepID=A0ABM9CRL7_9BACL|nr:ABC transporter permease subunit [Paenibacillus allorhizoplanae]CAH1222576.1 putative multiple-sugar transport system permease YteP [Paenibacillus allorhizoplanae]